MQVDIHNYLIVSSGGRSSDDYPVEQFQIYLASSSLSPSNNHVDILAMGLHLQLRFSELFSFS